VRIGIYLGIVYVHVAYIYDTVSGLLTLYRGVRGPLTHTPARYYYRLYWGVDCSTGLFGLLCVYCAL